MTAEAGALRELSTPRDALSASAWAIAGSALIYAAVGAVTGSLRFLALVGFTNDHFIHLAGAQQMLFGEWPTRDFVDPGHPLMFAASGLAQIALGRGLFAEAVFISLMLGTAASLTVAAGRGLTGSWWLGVFAAALEVAIFPRGYSYPKMLLYAAGPLVMWWYLRHPGGRRMGGLAMFIAMAFLFRHDHGAYLGVGAALTVGLAEGLVDAPRTAWRVIQRIAGLAVLVVAALAPYFLYIESTFGVMGYLERGIQFLGSDPPQTFMPVLNPYAAFMTNAPVLVFYLYYVIPVAAAVVLFRRRHERHSRHSIEQVVPLIVVALIVNWGFIRNFPEHVPDAVVLPALLGVWLLSVRPRQTAGPPALIGGAALAALVGIATVSIGAVGEVPEQLDRAGLFGGLARLPQRFAERAAELRDPYAERQMPAGPVAALVPFLKYIDRCTTQAHRLFVPGYAPEVPVYARRPFAGGDSIFLPNYHASAEYDRLVASRLERETVAFVVWGSRWEDALDRLPSAAAYVKERFVPLTSYPLNEGRRVRVLVNRTLPVVKVDPATGWPCFR